MISVWCIPASETILSFDSIELCSGARAIGLELCQMFLRPAAECTKRVDQGAAEARERIFNPRRHDRINFALNETVPFQTAQRLGQHLLRNAADLAMKLGITHGLF